MAHILINVNRNWNYCTVFVGSKGLNYGSTKGNKKIPQEIKNRTALFSYYV
jgi:hypothetical protein